MDKFAYGLTFVILVLFGVIFYKSMTPRVIIKEVPIVVQESPSVYMLPWSWGWGSYNNTGSAVIHRPQPHFPFHTRSHHTPSHRVPPHINPRPHGHLGKNISN